MATQLLSRFPPPRHQNGKENRPTTVSVIDSHTAGEPTRLVLAGGPDLGIAPLADQLEYLRAQFPAFRPSIVGEPRGSAVLVGALLCQPESPASTAAVIFFNEVGYLGMCGHGTIGLVHSLAFLGRIAPGLHRIETPVGDVTAKLHEDGSVSVTNVPAYRLHADVTVEVPGLGLVVGDVAWGGNWFFLIATPAPVSLEVANVEPLAQASLKVREALIAAGISGAAGASIDHIEWFAAPRDEAHHSRNFVLCPGTSYDRSPCGTGTSAKLACLAARGILAPGELWQQEGILGTVFTGRYSPEKPGSERIIPEITGRAWITGEAELTFEAGDPFRQGILFP